MLLETYCPKTVVTFLTEAASGSSLNCGRLPRQLRVLVTKGQDWQPSATFLSFRCIFSRVISDCPFSLRAGCLVTKGGAAEEAAEGSAALRPTPPGWSRSRWTGCRSGDARPNKTELLTLCQIRFAGPPLKIWRPFLTSTAVSGMSTSRRTTAPRRAVASASSVTSTRRSVQCSAVQFSAVQCSAVHHAGRRGRDGGPGRAQVRRAGAERPVRQVGGRVTGWLGDWVTG
jgi:hypothetical protein